MKSGMIHVRDEDAQRFRTFFAYQLMVTGTRGAADDYVPDGVAEKRNTCPRQYAFHRRDHIFFTEWSGGLIQEFGQ